MGQKIVFKLFNITLLLYLSGCTFSNGLNPFGESSIVDLISQPGQPTIHKLSIEVDTDNSTTLEPHFVVSGFTNVGLTSGTLKLLRDADENCSGGVVVDLLDVTTPAESQSLVARYGGFTSMNHSFSAQWIPAGGPPSCSLLTTKATEGTASGFSKIYTGSTTTCAITTTGTVQCWGANGSGEVGDGTIIKRATPVTIAGLSNIVEMGVGQAHACALDNVGAVKCWGINSLGSVGDGTNTQRLIPTAVTTLPAASQISVGSYHTCAIIAGGAVKCWGYNINGQLGDGTVTNRNAPVDVTVAAVPITNVVQLSLGSNYSCARMNTGTVKCWGNNTKKALADGTIVHQYNPVDIAGLTNVTSIAAGDDYTCARLNNGTVQCWGSTLDFPTDQGLTNVTAIWVNNTTLYAQQGAQFIRGTPGATPSFAAVGIDLPSHFTTKFTDRSCGVLSDTRARCWGADNVFGNYHRGDRAAEGQLQTRSVPLNNVTQVASYAYHSCAVLADKTVRCWGLNTSGQLGNGTTTNTHVPVNPGLTDVTAVAVGLNHSCAIHTDKTLKCWGLNTSGQLGDNSIIARHTPVLSTAVNVEAVTLGSTHTCAIITGGTVQCWGANANGQFGDGTTTPSLTPTASLLTNVVSLAAGSNRTCAALATGAVHCAGQSSAGWLGNGVGGNFPTPLTIMAAGNAITKVFSAGAQTCALNTTTLYCWGQIGTINSGWPGVVGKWFSGQTPVDVALGVGHSCAIMSNGNTWCWGDLQFGYRGDEVLEYERHQNNFIQIDTPTLATQLANASKLAVGQTTTCRLNSSGKLGCLGSSIYGGLGSEINVIDYNLPANATYVIER